MYHDLRHKRIYLSIYLSQKKDHAPKKVLQITHIWLTLSINYYEVFKHRSKKEGLGGLYLGGGNLCRQ